MLHAGRKTSSLLDECLLAIVVTVQGFLLLAEFEFKGSFIVMNTLGQFLRCQVVELVLNRDSFKYSLLTRNFVLVNISEFFENSVLSCINHLNHFPNIQTRKEIFSNDKWCTDDDIINMLGG